MSGTTRAERLATAIEITLDQEERPTSTQLESLFNQANELTDPAGSSRESTINVLIQTTRLYSAVKEHDVALIRKAGGEQKAEEYSDLIDEESRQTANRLLNADLSPKEAFSIFKAGINLRHIAVSSYFNGLRASILTNNGDYVAKFRSAVDAKAYQGALNDMLHHEFTFRLTENIDDLANNVQQLLRAGANPLTLIKCPQEIKGSAPVEYRTAFELAAKEHESIEDLDTREKFYTSIISPLELSKMALEETARRPVSSQSIGEASSPEDIDPRTPLLKLYKATGYGTGLPPTVGSINA